jgi:GABA permease
MESPFRSEAAAFRLLLITIGAFALIVAAFWIEPWLGVVTWVVLTVVAVWLYLRQRGPAAPPERVERAGEADERRVLVVANETLRGEELMSAISERALSGQAEFFVVSPALNSRLKTWTSDEDPARAEAQSRLDATLARLADVGIEARGEVGDVDPLVAIEDAVRSFRPDEIVLSTHPAGKSNWLERGVVAAARERFDLPVTHVIVESPAGEGSDPDGV